MRELAVAAALTFGACHDPIPARQPRKLVSEPVAGLAVGGGYAYYTSGDRVRRVALDGGDPETIAAASLPTGAIGISEKEVFWANGATQGQARVMRAPLGGGLPQTVAAGLHFPGAIAVDATDVFFVESCCSSQAVWRASKAGGAPVKLADIPARTFAFGLALDRTSVYWTQDAFGSGDGAILRLAKSGGAPEVLVPAQSGVGGVAVDGWNVYWFVSTGNAGPVDAVRRRALGGGAIVEVAADRAQALAADGRFVWWGTFEPSDGGNRARLRRSGAAGTDASTWIAGQQIARIGFDEKRVVWTDVDEPAIYVLDR